MLRPELSDIAKSLSPRQRMHLKAFALGRIYSDEMSRTWGSLIKKRLVELCGPEIRLTALGKELLAKYTN